MDVVCHQPALRPYIEQPFTLESLDQLDELLAAQETFQFHALPNGLFPAAIAEEYTGYSNIWVRDNVHLAHSFLALGEIDRAVGAVTGLTRFFHTQREKIEKLIAGTLDPDEPMNRPHIRFNGTKLAENPEKWSHAQNDALGYYLWIASKTVLEQHCHATPDDLRLLALFPALFQALQFWEDRDSGHWEETRKIEASSIGTATRGLQTFLQLLEVEDELPGLSSDERLKLHALTEEMISRGMQALAKILPWECREDDPLVRRRYDSALLFLIYPLGLLQPTDPQTRIIVGDVVGNLLGKFGIRRYLGDSYWCANYKDLLSEERRTTDVSDDTAERDSLLKPGEEAQWCIFDPILSVIFGQRWLQTKADEDRQHQLLHLRRSLGQITSSDGTWPAFRCPESYFLSGDTYIPNDVTPLLWTQANLRLALHQMRITLSHHE